MFDRFSAGGKCSVGWFVPKRNNFLGSTAANGHHEGTVCDSFMGAVVICSGLGNRPY